MNLLVRFTDAFRSSRMIPLVLAVTGCALFTQCASSSGGGGRGMRVATTDRVVVSVRDQKMLVQQNGMTERVYPVSTSKFGMGDIPRSNRTPLGRMYIYDKIGDGYPVGAVFKHRRATGEIVPPNSPGRDPIVTRIVQLGGLESQNQNCLRRTIYIHGTPEERNIGRPASYGCIRMRSNDVIDLYNRVQRGDRVTVIPGALPVSSRQASRSSGGYASGS